VFLNTSSDARLLPSTLEVAGQALADGEGVAERPTDAEMSYDVSALDMAPLFDGTDTLERI
jgi:hypothetical protein